ncbi:MAG: dihydroorotase family protein [archaeon]|nr:dihydroorotase family protein [archaeon]
MNLALTNGKVFIKGKLVKTNVLIQGSKIKKITSSKIKAIHEIDCKGKIILPGAIDAHVHFRTPGFEYKEDFFTGSLSALHGGITTIMDMPNTNPVTSTIKTRDVKIKLAEKNCLTNFYIYMAALNSNLEEISKAKNLRAVKLYYGSTTGNILMNKKSEIEKLFKLAKKKGFVVSVHAEDEEIMKQNSEKFRGNSNPEIHAKIRNEESEAKAISEILSIQQIIGNKIHIAHISSEKGLALVKKAKKRMNGNKVTCEVTPHHLFLDSSDYKKLGNLMKCNPSIKEAKHRKALLNGLKNGAIDIVATDHAPHSREEKTQDYWKSPSGIPGEETMLPLLLDAVNKKQISLKKIVEAVAENPAGIFGWKNKGFIKTGFDADLVIINMNGKTKIEDKKLFTKAGYSPWNKKTLKAMVENTIIGGQVFG